MQSNEIKRKSIGYAIIVVCFCAFSLIIYGAYSPARKSQKQQIVCYKFKEGLKKEAVEQHLRDFAALKHEIPQIVSYSAGKTLTTKGAAEYDVMHYITFQSEADIETYNKHQSHQEFLKKHQSDWERVLVINSDIHP